MLKTYDFKQVSCIVGASIITGFAEGDDAIAIEILSEAFTLVVGADGEATRSKSNNKSARITLKLQKSSDANDILNGYYQSDKLSNTGVFSFLVKDNNGRELHVAQQCYIEKAPNANYGASSGDREWVLVTNDLDSTFGGN